MNKIKVFAINMMCLWAFMTQAQVLTFHKTYNSNNIRYFARSIAPANEGYYMVAEVENLSSAAGNKGLLMRLNALGEPQWTWQYGDSAAWVSICSVTKSNLDDGIITYGRVIDSLGAPGTLWLAKFDYIGHKVWEKRLQFPDYDLTPQGQILPVDGGYLLSGLIAHSNPFIYYTLTTRIDEAGNILWSKGQNDSYDDLSNRHEAYCVQDSLIYSAGGSFFFPGGFRVSRLSDGELKDVKTVSAPNTAHFSGIYPTVDGKWLACGTLDLSPTANNDVGVLIHKTDFGNSSIGSTKILKVNGFSNYHCQMQPTSDDGFILLIRNDDFQTVLAKLDQNGNPVWSFLYNYAIYQVVPTADGGFVAVGAAFKNGATINSVVIKMDANGVIYGCPSNPVQINTDTYELFPNPESIVYGESFSYNSLGPVAARTPLPFSRLVVCGNGSTPTSEITTPAISVFPNPATDQVMVKGEALAMARYELLDMTGKTVATGRFSASDAVLRVDALTAGAYTLRVVTPNGETASSVILKL